jgi:uncharacterized protein YkwD
MPHRPHIIPTALTALIICAAAAGPAEARSSKMASFTPESPGAKASNAGCDNATSRAGEVSESALARSTVCLLNQERNERGLHSLRVNNRLSGAARQHTDDMVRRRYFSHTSRSGNNMSDRIRSHGYLRGARSWMIGENLAWGSGERSTPRRIVAAWMASPGHRRNILTGKFREIGIGVVDHTPVTTGKRGATYTTTFGARS